MFLRISGLIGMYMRLGIIFMSLRYFQDIECPKWFSGYRVSLVFLRL